MAVKSGACVMNAYQLQVLGPSDASHIPAGHSSVFDTLKRRLAQISELASSSGWMSVVREMIFFNRIAIVVEKDLSEIVEHPELLQALKMTVVEIDTEMLSSGNYHFAVRSRHLKAHHYLEVGYGGFALVREQKVIGDTWYVPSRATDNARLLHKDLGTFGFTSWLANHVYTFDIFVAPEARKGKIAPAFQNAAMLLLRAKGYTKAFGFYWADNIPAHWCTRVTNKWKKLRSLRVSRLILLQRALPKPE
jgi:GNAT superfamily N-acetyltransferase